MAGVLLDLNISEVGRKISLFFVQNSQKGSVFFNVGIRFDREWDRGMTNNLWFIKQSNSLLKTPCSYTVALLAPN